MIALLKPDKDIIEPKDHQEVSWSGSIWRTLNRMRTGVESTKDNL